MEGDVVPVELNFELFRLVEKYAEKKGLTVEAVVQKIILQYLAHNAHLPEARILTKNVIAHIPEKR